MKSYILGIDPGKKGAITLLNPDGTLKWCEDISEDEDQTAVIIEDAASVKGQIFCYIEDTVTPKWQNIKALKTQNVNLGILRGMVRMAEIPYKMVHPKTWQSVIFKGLPTAKDKSRSFFVCRNLFPDIKLCRSNRKTPEYDGRADSACIAYYGFYKHVFQVNTGGD